MKMQKVFSIGLAIFISALSAECVLADAISPHVDGSNIQYSGEPVNAAFFGTGPAAYLTEASQLRFQGAEDTRSGKPEQALRKLSKAVQLDPGDPEGHLLYARALSAKIKASPNDASTLPLVYKALDEWKMLWHHDADQFDQTEAKNEARRLNKIAKSIIKQEHSNHGISQEEALAAAMHRSMQ